MKFNLITKTVFLSMTIALGILTSRSALAAILTNYTQPFSFTFLNPCNGDSMISAGVDHITASTTFNGAGFQTTLHVNEQQARDTDTTTGQVCTDTFNLNEEGHDYDVISGTVGGLPLVITVHATGLVTCPHQAGSLIATSAFHITVNPNGTVTVFRDNVGDLTCR